MTGLATALDHVGVAVPDLDAAATEWAALGFTVQPLAPHMADGTPAGTNGHRVPTGTDGQRVPTGTDGQRVPTGTGGQRVPTGTGGQRVPTGTGNRNIMLREGYIELLATIDPARPSATIARFLAHHTGIHVLTLATDDADAALARLATAGFSAAIARSARPADPAAPDGPQAAFARIPLAEADPRLQLLHHLTPALVWQERFLSHPNRAIALREVIVAADAPAAFAARLARAAGLPLVPDPAGGLALRLPGVRLPGVHLPGGAVRVLPPDAATRLLPGAAIPALPAILGLVVQTDDSARTAAALLGHSDAGPVHRPVWGRASGVTVVFSGS